MEQQTWTGAAREVWHAAARHKMLSGLIAVCVAASLVAVAVVASGSAGPAGAAPDPAARRLEIEARLQALASPFLTAEATGQDIIDPRETRSRLVEFVHDAQRILGTQLGPPPMPYLP